jgi:translocation and assembly module TamB
VRGEVHFKGPVAAPTPSGKITLTQGMYQKRRDQLSITDANAEIGFARGNVELRSLSARVGGGEIAAKGSVPLLGLGFGDFRGVATIRDLSIPALDGIAATIDADIDAVWAKEEDKYLLPKLTGEVRLTRFKYTRAVTMNADIATLTRRGRRTEFESYDPSKDVVELDLMVSADKPLTIANSLIETPVRIEPPGLQLTGTNQRFGLRGRLELPPGGRIQLRRNEFEVQRGEIRFTDATAIVPEVDVSAVTEYQRYSSSGLAQTAPNAGGDSARLGAAAGQWRIFMRAHGDAENLKIDLTSQPKLSQDDIFFLLTVGLTRAELDQAQAAGVGQSVALEALGSLTGADQALTEALPVIDEFRFGSAYSSRTGRTEPTITVGKRLTDRIRAYVTGGVNSSQEVRSNVQWQLSPSVSVEGSYDNVNNISSAGIGNLGADIRWRLEFN